MIGGGGILANIDHRLVPQSPTYMPPARDPTDQTGLASVKGEDDLGRNALCIPDRLKSLGDLSQARNVIQCGDDGQVADREDLVRPIKPRRWHIDDH